MTDPFLAAVENLSRFHHEHEKFYAQDPRQQAVLVQRHARTVAALADRWMTTSPAPLNAMNPYEGAEDLNAGEALQLDGVLFMEGEGEPAEISRLKRDLRTAADDLIGTGAWLGSAMEMSWDVATGLMRYVELADLLGDRHRIIANDWQAASMSTLAGRLLHRGVDFLDAVDFSPASIRQDLDAARTYPALMYSAVELLDRSADLLSDSAGLVHDNERRWRTFRQRLLPLVQGPSPPVTT